MLRSNFGSTAAYADTVTVSSYEMNNGNGTFSNGTYNYFDVPMSELHQRRIRLRRRRR